MEEGEGQSRILIRLLTLVFKDQRLFKGAFKNYVDKTRYVGGSLNVNFI